MSVDHVALVQRFLDCWNRRDLAAALSCVDPDIEFDWSESRGPFSGIYTGRNGIKRFWSDMLDAWDTFHLELEEGITVGPGLVMTSNAVHARGKGSGVEVHARGAMTWRVRDDKILEARFFQTKEEALVAVAGPTRTS